MFARIVIVAGALLVFLAAGLRTWGAAYLRTEVVHDTAQHSEALVADGPFRYTRNPLYLASLANGGWNWRLSQPLWICFSGAGKLDFCLSADSSRRRIPAENPKGIISRVLPIGAAFLARAKGARSVRKSPPRLGSGLRRRELCLAVRFRRAVDRCDSESPARSSRVFARVRRAFFNHATHPKAPMRVTGVVGRLLAGVTTCLSYKMQKSHDIAVVTLACSSRHWATSFLRVCTRSPWFSFPGHHGFRTTRAACDLCRRSSALRGLAFSFRASFPFRSCT